MSGENWTPGPWHVYAGALTTHVLGADRNTVASCRAKGRWVESAATELARANAQLIAAAPELYEALVAAQDLIAPENVQERAMIRAALANARGEVQP